MISRATLQRSIHTLLESFDTSLSFAAIVARTFLIKKRKVEHYVLLKNLGGIGDYVMLTASFEGYRRLYSESRIVLLVRSDVKEFAESNPHVDYVIAIDYNKCCRNVFHRVRLWHALLRFDFAVFVNLDYSTNYEILDRAISQWSFARQKVAHLCLDKGSSREYDLYDTIITHQDEWQFEIERNNEMLRQLGLPTYDNLVTRISNIERFVYSNRIEPLLPNRPYYLVAPGSLLEGKCWPSSKYAILIDRLSSWGFQVAICGGPDDSQAASEIEVLAQTSGIIDLTGKSRLVDFSLLIKDAEFIICNDSSAAHIAQATGTQAFVVLGGGHFGRFLPYPEKRFVHPIYIEGMDCFYCYWKCRFEYFKCVQDIEVEFVYRQICESMGRDVADVNVVH